jgi:hypothetical protein
MKEFLLDMYLGWIIALFDRYSDTGDAVLLFFLNLVMWIITLLVALLIYIGFDRGLSEEHYNHTDTVVSIKFVPEHAQLVGKVVQRVPDTWHVKTSNNTVCPSTVDMFKVGDKVLLDYSVGGLTDIKYCDKIGLEADKYLPRY